jgi:hypothetical protein
LDVLRKAVEKSGRKFVFVIPPDKTTMVPQHLPASYPNKECSQAVAGKDWAQVTAPGGGALDLRPELRASEQRMGRPVYPPNDTHWTDEGALVMTRGIANAIHPGITHTWDSKAVGRYSAGADLPPMLGKRASKSNVLYDLRPDGENDRTGPDVADIDTPVTRAAEPITGTVNEKTLVFGDSFTKAAARYLSGGFSNLTMLAYYTKQNDQATALNAMVDSDVVVIETVERSVFSGNLPFLEDSFLNAAQRKLEQHPVR